MHLSKEGEDDDSKIKLVFSDGHEGSYVRYFTKASTKEKTRKDKEVVSDAESKKYDLADLEEIEFVTTADGRTLVKEDYENEEKEYIEEHGESGRLIECKDYYRLVQDIKDSADFFDKLEIYEGTEPEVRVHIRIRDVKKLLGIKIKYQLDYRIVIYLAIMGVLLTVTVALILLTYKINNMDGNGAWLVYLLWIATAILCAITVIMIIYFVLNPQLIFGELTYINKTFYNITGHYLPNPSKGMYEW